MGISNLVNCHEREISLRILVFLFMLGKLQILLAFLASIVKADNDPNKT